MRTMRFSPFWELPDAESYVEKIRALVQGKPLMLGVYLFDYGTGGVPMDPVLFENQLTLYLDYLRR